MRKMEKKSKNKNGKEKKKTAKKSENKRGRPTIITPEIIAKLEQAFSLGCSDLEACIYADIGKTALYDYQEKNPEFTERKEALKQKVTRVKLKLKAISNNIETYVHNILSKLE